MRIKLARALALCSFTVAATPLVAQDLTIVFKETGGSGAPATTSQYYTKTKNRTNGLGSDTMIDYTTGTITMIDHKKKEYSETTAAEIEAAMKKMSAEMEKMNAQMAALPESVREKMGMANAGAVTVTKGGVKKIAGYDAQQYTVAMGQMMSMETWNTTALKYPIPEADLKRYASLAGSASAIAANPMFQGMSKLTEELKKIEGMTLGQTTTFKIMGKTNVSTKEAVEVKLDPVPDSVFALPAGYKKVQSGMAKMAK